MFICRVCLGLLLCAFCCLTGLRAHIEIGEPRARWATLDEVDGNWLEVEVPLTRRGDAPAGELELRLELLLPIRETKINHTLLAHGEVRLLGLFEGNRKVFLYLPEEAVEHYGIDRRIIAWRIQVNGEFRKGGASQESIRRLFDQSSNSGPRIGFQRLYETPFYSETYPEKLAASPSYVR